MPPEARLRGHATRPGLAGLGAPRPTRTAQRLGAVDAGGPLLARSAPRPAASAGARPGGRSPRLVPERALRVCDVALFYAPRSGGIRTYLDAKAAHVEATGAYEHHVIVPGPVEHHEAGRHTLPSVALTASNGYRLPLGVSRLEQTLARIRPDVVLLHDPFWGPVNVTRTAHRLGAKVVAVHHGSSELDAAGLPGPDGLYVGVLRAWLRRAYRSADAVMSVVDPFPDCGRPADLPLRLGVHEAFRPQSGVARGDHVLYVGRLAREKGVLELLEAAARSREPWELRLVGSGPLEDQLRARAARYGIAHRVTFAPFVADREELARLYAGARCVVMPGVHETFGLVGLEAAASGARVVACATAPSARECGALAHRFEPGDLRGLVEAIADARWARQDLMSAAALAWRMRWAQLFAAEQRGLVAL